MLQTVEGNRSSFMETGSFLLLAFALHEKIKIPRSHVFVKSKEPLSSMTGN